MIFQYRLALAHKHKQNHLFNEKQQVIISSYIYIPVSDLEKSASWYEKNLGFKVVYKDALYYDIRTENGVKIMLIPNENNIISQMKYPTGEQPAYGFIVDDFDEIKRALQTNGVKTGEVFDYFGHSFSFFDLDGNKIEIWEKYEYESK